MDGKGSYKVSEETKEAILCSATEIFAKYGYKGSSMSNIAQNCGVNKALIYYHYKNKKMLYNEIFQSTVLLLRESLVRESDKKSFMERVEKVADYLGKKPNFSLLLTKELGTSGENLDKKTKQMIQETILSLSESSPDRVFAFGVFGAIHFLNIAQNFFEDSKILEKNGSPLATRFVKSLKENIR